VAEILTAPQVDRVQATVTVFRPGLGWRDVAIDYVPGYGDPLARALLDKAQELNRAAVAAATGPPTFGGIS